MSLARWCLLVVALIVGLASRAFACGGCFSPPQMTGVSEVVGHRMVFAISNERSVLWDQFEYSGSPEEFSWVLPIQPGAYLEEAEQAWFDALDAATEASVSSPALACGGGTGQSGCACGAMSADASGASAESSYQGPPSVQVVDRRTVGPYQVVTLHSEAGDELFRWFDDNGYFVPEDIAPIIEAYVSEGADFIAVKLRPGQGVQQMTPVRVVTPGGEGILPLRMVAAGVRDQVDIVLYVIGEHRYRMPDLVEVFVSDAELEWDFTRNDSNYLRLRQSALSENGGFSYLTSFALAGAFADDGVRSMSTAAGRFVTSISDLYVAQAAEADDVPPPCALGVLPARLDTPLRIVEDGDTQTLPASGALECGNYTDLAAAMVGLVPRAAWLTRLELTLPRTALAMDCILEPHDSTAAVSAFRSAAKAKNPPAGCEAAGISNATVARPMNPALILWLALGVVAVALTRRRAFG
ncbi:MAG TPA: DUF2330 domain-containing protein [Polyangiaceae bacterium]